MTNLVYDRWRINTLVGWNGTGAVLGYWSIGLGGNGRRVVASIHFGYSFDMIPGGIATFLVFLSMFRSFYCCIFFYGVTCRRWFETAMLDLAGPIRSSVDGVNLHCELACQPTLFWGATRGLTVLFLGIFTLGLEKGNPADNPRCTLVNGVFSPTSLSMSRADCFRRSPLRTQPTPW